MVESGPLGYPVPKAPGHGSCDPRHVLSRDSRLAIIGVPWYPMYKTLTVAPDPFIEWVVRAARSTGGRVGTHMLIQVLS
jgi:hypothetical protein